MLCCEKTQLIEELMAKHNLTYAQAEDLLERKIKFETLRAEKFNYKKESNNA